MVYALFSLLMLGVLVAGDLLLARAIRFGTLRLFGVRDARLLGPEESFSVPRWAHPVAGALMVLAVYITVGGLGTAGSLAIGGAQTTTRVAPLPESEAVRAGIQHGDRVLSVAGTRVTQFEEIAPILQKNAGTPVTIEIERNGRTWPFEVTPGAPGTQKAGKIGVATIREEVPASLKASLATGFEYPFVVARGFLDILGPPKGEVMGPVGIVKEMQAAPREGSVVGMALWLLAAAQMLGFVALPALALATIRPRRRPEKRVAASP